MNRSALGLALVSGKPYRIENIRAKQGSGGRFRTGALSGHSQTHLELLRRVLACAERSISDAPSISHGFDSLGRLSYMLILRIALDAFLHRGGGCFEIELCVAR
jgi:hypothetical protein